MSKKTKIAITILLIAISSLSAVIVLANSAATHLLYLPLVYGPEVTETPEPTPEAELVVAGFVPSDNPQEDYVTLSNETDGELDLTDWWLKAETQSGRYTFPISFTLGVSETVNVRSGVGTDTGDDLYIGLPYALWSIEGNCVYVRDLNGDLQDSRCVDDAPPPTPTPEPTYSVGISGFNPDPVPEEDYVTISNSTTETFDLTGWWMKAETESGRYDFPDGFILYGNSSVNVRSGIGTDGAYDLYIGGDYSLWTENSNCAYLRYSDGTLLDKKCVGE